jgi:hypothetical protein
MQKAFFNLKELKEAESLSLCNANVWVGFTLALLSYGAWPP